MAPVATDYANNASHEVERETELGDRILETTLETKTLPARWMRDENIFQLEKRAIFSKVRLATAVIASFSGPLLGYETS